MVNYFMVEYTFCNGFTTVIKRQKFQGDIRGKIEAKKKYVTGVKYIKWNSSEDYERMEMIADTTNNGKIVIFHYDTQLGYKNNNTKEVYCYG